MPSFGGATHPWLLPYHVITPPYTYDALARVTDLMTRTGPGAMDPLLNSFTGMVHDGSGNRLSLNASIPAHVAYSGTTNY